MPAANVQAPLVWLKVRRRIHFSLVGELTTALLEFILFQKIITSRKWVNKMPCENTLALLIAIRKYADKTNDIEELKKFVDMLIASIIIEAIH